MILENGEPSVNPHRCPNTVIPHVDQYQCDMGVGHGLDHRSQTFQTLIDGTTAEVVVTWHQ